MARVLVGFRDRDTWVPYAAGDEYRGSPERVAELAAAGYVEAQRKPAPRRAARKPAPKE